ncbi:sensor histidine kinase [Candidatus Poriferisodalis sp.]|uniref:sensor histidine kinase n=1 Tax=Candidatus Poriferisodalis sp. TaxID=3101277 RepID=UPI003AF8F261
MRASFRFAPDILRRLGEELNPSLEHGVVELVKNAHDADANHCSVSLEDVTIPGGAIRVTDDGDGMTADEIIDHFLLLGKSAKSSTYRSRRGRNLAGSKGLGRLAAMRAGKRAVLTTRPRAEPDTEYRLSLDWAAFEDVESVDDVELQVEHRKRAEGTGSGTEIVVQQLFSSINKRDVKKLARALLLLSDPFAEHPSDFRTSLNAEEFRDLTDLVRKKYFDDAEYVLELSTSETGVASAFVLDWKGDALFEATHEDLRQTDQPYSCPKAQFDLWVFILDSKRFQTRRSSLRDVQTWLGEFGGVALYVNDIRVPPYGDSGNDWLDMNLRRTQSPEERPSTNTAIGRFRVWDEDRCLVAKTDRSGIIDSREFVELRYAAMDALDWMARRRLEVAERRRRATRESRQRSSSRSQEDVEDAISRVRNEIGEPAGLEQAFQGYVAARDREVERMREEVQLYRTLSTAGISAATFAHESVGGPLKILSDALPSLERRLKAYWESLPANLAEPLHLIHSGAESLGALGASTLSLVERDKRRRGRVEIHEVAKSVATAYRPFVEAHDASFELHLDSSSDPHLQGSIAAIESIIVNLLTNSLVAIPKSTRSPRLVRLMTVVERDQLTLSVADTGAGIDEHGVEEIWLPGVTSRPQGSGLGLTIVRDTVTDLGGTAEAVANGDLGGATFLIRLPILRVE